MLDSPDHIRVPGDPSAGFMAGFGLSRFEQAGCVLNSIERVDDSVRLGFCWAGIGNAVVAITGDDGGQAFARSSHLLFRFVGTAVVRPWAVLMGRMAAEAGERTITDLFELAGLTVPADRPSVTVEVQPPFNPILNWGPPDGWRQFVCDAAMERRFREAFEFDSDSSFIVHGDLECRFVAPGARVRLPGHFVYPFDPFSHTEAVGPVTDLKDRDVIMDPALKIEERVLREAASGSITGPVVVISTCVPVVVAEDPSPVLKRLAAVCPHGIRYVTPLSPVNPTETFMESFTGLRESVLSVPPTRRSVGFVGYKPGRARSELERLLVEAGMSVTGGIVPMVTRSLLSSTLSAAAIVVAPSRYHEAAFLSLVDGARAAGRQILKPGFPWGVSATSKWLDGIAAAFGLADESRAIADAGAAAARAGLAGVSPSESVFLFVTDAAGMQRLVDPLSPAGLPLLPVMCDLGLRSRVLVYSAASTAGEAIARCREVVSGIPGADLIEFAAFDSEDSLSGLFTAPDASAVYSEMFFDYRATRNGLPTFSSRIFEPGFGGAVRTAARFRRLARLPFYRRYLKVM